MSTKKTTTSKIKQKTTKPKKVKEKIVEPVLDPEITEHEITVDLNENSSLDTVVNSIQEQNDANVDSSIPQQEPLAKSDANKIFFEKFERTKKDVLKERRAQKIKTIKSLKAKNKMLGFDYKLRDDGFIKNSWIVFIILSIFLVAYSAVCLGFLGSFFNGTNDTKWSVANLHLDMTRTIIIFSSVVIILVPIPYIYLMGTWFVGINGSHKSKIFFIVIFMFLLISTVLTLLVIPMSSVIFDNVRRFSPIA